MPKDRIKNRAGILPAGELALPTTEEREFKGSVTVKELEVPRLEGIAPGELVELTFEAEIVDIRESEEGTEYRMDIRSFGYMDKETSLEQAEKAAKESK